MKFTLAAIALIAPSVVIATHAPFLGEFAASTAQCQADYVSFTNDVNGCVPGAYVNGKASSTVTPTPDQLKCLCSSNVGVDLTNAKSDCSGDDLTAVNIISNQFFQVCPNAKTKNAGRSTSVSMMSVAAVAIGAVVMGL
ncbi:hypothetical protein HDU76_004569 [Blyttiomyces sp. JEL0837]|nr:hypothetical protein HDU76_004569 [Blyttiomyces sp. JEL0837]